MVITVEEARAYARDYESTDEEMTALIEVAESMIDDGIRAGFNRESPQAKMLAKLLVTDLDDKRELTAAEANSMRYLTQSLKMQLRYKDVSKLDTPEPYTPAPVGRRETVDLRRLLSHAASGEGTIGAAIDADTYHKMLAISK